MTQLRAPQLLQELKVKLLLNEAAVTMRTIKIHRATKVAKFTAVARVVGRFLRPVKPEGCRRREAPITVANIWILRMSLRR